MFAAETFGVIPDIVVCGKGISSGVLPVAAMVARQKMAEPFQQGPDGAARFFAHGHTYANGPMACAVGIAVIDEIERLGLCARARELGARIRRRLEALRRYGVIREVRGRGLLLGVELARDASVPPAEMLPFPELGTALRRTALANGLILRVDPGWFAVGPALTTTDEEADEMCRLIEVSLQDALRAVGAPAAARL